MPRFHWVLAYANPPVPGETFHRRVSRMSGSGMPEDDSETSDARVRVDWSTVDEPTIHIVEAVAAATNRNPTNLPLLDEAIDGDALNTLLGSDQGDTVTLTFNYASTHVEVRTGEYIEVHPQAE